MSADLPYRMSPAEERDWVQQRATTKALVMAALIGSNYGEAGSPASKRALREADEMSDMIMQRAGVL